MELKKRFSARRIFSELFAMFIVPFAFFNVQPEVTSSYAISSAVEIPSIELVSDVTALDLSEGKLNTPETIVGSYSRFKNKTLLIGHSTTVFGALKYVAVGDSITYGTKRYEVINVEILAKEDVDMDELLAYNPEETIVLMTCDGELYENGDASHRVIVTAKR